MNKKQIREKFRNDVFKRDNNTCKLCKRTGIKLDAHHITNRSEFKNGGYTFLNGISLCDPEGEEDGCHLKVERFYFSDGMENEPESMYHPDNLYWLIGSSKEQAFKDDLK